MPASKPLTVALLVVPEVSASTLYGLYDTLRSAGRHWQMMHGEAEPTPPSGHWSSAATAGLSSLRAGRSSSPMRRWPMRKQAAIVCISTLEVPPDEALDDRYDAEAAWVRGCFERGATVASACSGAVLLARTGLLDGLEATSHWAYCDALRREYPGTRWHPERTLVASGADQRIVMAGSGISWHLLAMHLIARFAAPQQAMQVARMKLMDLNAASPIAYASLKYTGRTADPLVARCQQWAALNYATASPVTQMVALSGLPERTFKRRFALATGMSPLEYVHALRTRRGQADAGGRRRAGRSHRARSRLPGRRLLRPPVPAQGVDDARAVPWALRQAGSTAVELIAEPHTMRRTIISLILPMASAGFSPFGQTSVQFRMVRQRNKR